MKLALTVALLVSALSTSLMAAESHFLSFTQTDRQLESSKVFSDEDQKYYTIASVEVTPIETQMESVTMTKVDGQKDLGTMIAAAEKLLAFGQKIWKIIQDGKPVVTTNFVPAVSVIPNVDGTSAPFGEMENWSAPAFQKFKVEYKNLFGMTVIGFTYTVTYQYNGSFEGKGKYLTGVTVFASDISVSWGFSFDAASSLVNIANRGTRAQPMASANMKIDYVAKSPLKEIRSTEVFHVVGNGQIVKY